MLVTVGMFAAALLLSGGAAQAHGKHEPAIVSAEVQAHGEHAAAKVHQGHCHSGAFCSGPAIIQQSTLTTGLFRCSERYGLPRATKAIPVVSNFDPPPPKILI
ncbi:hypothetical protein [Ruegeria arenilitoris]|uniref:hypothetical protein n=1 Tax=Ruegeria arenilitoris TaxID=1173585 RepID=UPI00147D41FE|nr:hypothetical protein [Ruegeria arenilitoris]